MFSPEQGLQAHIQGLEILHQLANAESQANSVDELLQLATQIFNDRLYFDSLTIGLIDENHQVVRFFTPSQPDLKYSCQPSIPMGVGITGEVIRSGEIVRIADVRMDSRYIGENPTIRSEMCIPRVSRNKAIGVINAEGIHLDGFCECEEKFLATIASQLTTEIEKERLFFDLQQSNTELIQTYDTTILGWAKALEIRDNETKGHSIRVAKLAVKIAREKGGITAYKRGHAAHL